MNNKAKWFIVCILLLIVIVLSYYIITHKNSNHTDTSNVEKTKKEFRDHDYVFNTSYSSNDIAFPYINLEYSNVSRINFRIKDLYETNRSNISSSSYEYFINEKILSVVLKAKINDKMNYYTYNINMDNGKEITFEDVYYKYSTSDLTLKDKIREYIDNSAEIQSHLDEIVLTKEYVIDTSYDNYKINTLSNNVDFYLGNNNKLNVIIKIDLNEVYHEYAVFQI